MTSSKLEVLTLRTVRLFSSTTSHRWRLACSLLTAGAENNTVALAKAAKVFNIPTIITTVETESFSGNTYPELLDVFPAGTFWSVPP